ncbi:MAG TPA: hypothetical protein VLS89_12400, partial [Candidatus Nanopelagicales bacterium]|nr:hypothetical protein [Candidatus Nanopelagicales bacterium]
MKRLKILFVQPAFSGGARLALGRAAWVCEPVSLTSLAALAPEHEARVLDLRIEGGAALGPALRDMRPDLVVVAPDEGETAPARAVLRVARGLLGRAAATALAAPPGDAEPPPREDPAIDTVIQGDPEPAFQALLAHLAGGGDPRRFDPGALPPLDLDSLPPPARHLLAPYRRHYFFAVAQPAAALRTARGARRMSAETICDRLQIIPEDFVLLLDDDAFSDPLRLAQLAEALVRRDIHKYWAAQARPEHIAEHPHLALALRDAGLAAVILHFDVGEADGL